MRDTEFAVVRAGLNYKFGSYRIDGAFRFGLSVPSPDHLAAFVVVTRLDEQSSRRFRFFCLGPRDVPASRVEPFKVLLTAIVPRSAV